MTYGKFDLAVGICFGLAWGTGIFSFMHHDWMRAALGFSLFMFGWYLVRMVKWVMRKVSR